MQFGMSKQAAHTFGLSYRPYMFPTAFQQCCAEATTFMFMISKATFASSFI